jgi:hypothetical protein
MKVYCQIMTIIIDLTFKEKRKRNFYGQTTYIVKVSFFDVSTSITSYLAFNLEKKKKKLNLIVAVYNLNKYLLFK